MDSPGRQEKSEEISSLLAQGLDDYGEDAIGKALQSWRQVLELDPQNPEALDYIRTADRRDQRRLPPEEQLSDTQRNVIHEVRGRLQAADWEGALDLLRGSCDGEPAVLEYEATLEIVRSRLWHQYGERVGALDGVPTLRGGASDLTEHDLPPDVGFMLSLVDGTTPLADLISLSGMDASEALRVLSKLLDAEIVEMSG
jgi:hypothetical protein